MPQYAVVAYVRSAVGTFVEELRVTPTVFLQVEHGAYRMRELHDRLNTTLFQQDEPWPYMPHLTIVKMATLAEAETAQRDAQRRWAHFLDSRRILVDQLTFVRESTAGRWTDLAPVRLGKALSTTKTS
jgi:2'-5' RNA ligase